MKIEILDKAQDDLIQGFHFYEAREPGLGPYFLDCLFSDIDSLRDSAPHNGALLPCPLARLSDASSSDGVPDVD